MFSQATVDFKESDCEPFKESCTESDGPWALSLNRPTEGHEKANYMPFGPSIVECPFDEHVEKSLWEAENRAIRRWRVWVAFSKRRPLVGCVFDAWKRFMEFNRAIRKRNPFMRVILDAWFIEHQAYVVYARWMNWRKNVASLCGAKQLPV